MQDAIPRPNADLALVQTKRLIAELKAQPYTQEIGLRLVTLEKWVADRERNPIVPPEYRVRRFRPKLKEPLGYKHPGPNFNFPFRS